MSKRQVTKIAAQLEPKFSLHKAVKIGKPFLLQEEPNWPRQTGSSMSHDLKMDVEDSREIQ